VPAAPVTIPRTTPSTAQPPAVHLGPPRPPRRPPSPPDPDPAPIPTEWWPF
jgi:hypothetical protein